jgi:chromosomal replication initiation ATPase DnaA
VTNAPLQLVLDLPHRPALEAEDFIVSASNAAAVEMIDRWPTWPGHALVVTGPAASGKTHLASVWRRRSGAPMRAAAVTDEAAVLRMAEVHAGVVEDLDRGIADERALFHLLNMAREQAGHVLLTARTRPGEWEIALPDLRSRARSLPVVAIEAPDETLLGAVIVKLLADRQLPATPPAVAYLVRHMERSFEMAARLVAEIDRLLWQKPREVTREVAKEALASSMRGSVDASD